jgi:hypothetical protein
MMRAAHELVKDGHDPRLLFLYKLMSHEDFFKMLDEQKGK